MPYQKREDTFPPGPFLLWGFPRVEREKSVTGRANKNSAIDCADCGICLSHLAPRRECSPRGANVLALSVQIGDDRIAAELVKEAVGAFLLIRDRDVLIHVFAVARPGGDKRPTMTFSLRPRR